MQISHKTQAVLQFLVPTAILYTIFGAYLLNESWPTLSMMRENSAGLAFVAIAGMLVQDLVPKPMKEALVFWRLKDRLPGHRAFSVKFTGHPHVNSANIQDLERLSTASPVDQQRHFYSLYKLVAISDAVKHFSQRYIAWRDLSALLFLFCVTSIPVVYSIDSHRVLSIGLILCGVALLGCLATSFAARNVANALVIQVLSETVDGRGGHG